MRFCDMSYSKTIALRRDNESLRYGLRPIAI